MIKQYLKSKFKTLLAFAVFAFIFTLVSVLNDVSVDVYLYAILLCVFTGLVFMLYDYYRYYEKARKLKALRHKAAVGIDRLPKAVDKIEENYQKIIRTLDLRAKEALSKGDMAISDMIDYYTMWVHQIKTPIAALRLLLETEECSAKSEMQVEIFKIEQYVEMALQYLRLDSEQTDFLFMRQPIDPIIKDAVKKYSGIFIKKKILLEYEPLNMDIISDEKWLGFVIEQILSNSLKYTPKGKISIYLDDKNAKTLVIEDTGIGIKEEDIPRVCDRGYTGYNGRNDKKSTGIGLYLCQSVLEKLGHSMSIESEVGKGTKVKIKLSYRSTQFE